jgi:hypothetical protein
MVGLYLFALALWLALGSKRAPKRNLAIIALSVLAVARIHYLTFVCVGVLLAIVVSRRAMIRISGSEFDPRRLIFILIVAMLAGFLAWTGADWVMQQFYDIDLTMQPPARLSQATSLAAYPLIFGVIQTLLLPVGLLAMASIYYRSHFKGEGGEFGLDPLLLFVVWLTFLAFSAGFFQVEYYPFRFNSFLMLPFGVISLVGLLHARKFVTNRRLFRTVGVVSLPLVVLLVVMQPVAQSLVALDQGDRLLPWKQEYGGTEVPALQWVRENLLAGRDLATGGAFDYGRTQMLMADWVRSRTLRALGYENAHLHWWFFQGVNVMTGEPYPFRNLNIYAGNITQALLLLGRLNTRSGIGGSGDEAYYHKYIYASDSIAQLTQREFGTDSDMEKFDGYDGRYTYHLVWDYYEMDSVEPVSKTYDPARYRYTRGPRGGEMIGYYEPLRLLDSYIRVYRLRPMDRVYSGGEVRIYYRTPL